MSAPSGLWSFILLKQNEVKYFSIGVLQNIFRDKDFLETP